MRRFVLLLSLLCFTCASARLALADVDPFACRQRDGSVSSLQASQLVQEVQKQYGTVESLSARFKQRSFIVALAEGEESSGEMSFSKPGRMRWSYETPRAQEVLIRDGIMSLYQVDTQQVIIQDVKEALISALPIAFLMGMGDIDRDFRVISACKTASNDVALTLEQNSQVSENDTNEELGGFILLVDSGKKIPVGAKITAVGGNITEIIFSNQVFNKIRANSPRFVLDYPTGVDLVDRR